MADKPKNKRKQSTPPSDVSEKTAASVSAASVSGESAPAEAVPEAVPPGFQLVLGRPLGGVGSESNIRLMLVLVSAICGVTFFAWGGAKVACNAHPPTYQKFKRASVERLTASPKAAALEFHHALHTNQFERAREVSKEEAWPLVDTAEKACGPACLAETEARLIGVKTRAIVLDKRRNRGEVRAESYYKGGKYLDTYNVSRKGRRWSVAEVSH